MWYQVMIRARGASAWTPFAEPTDDPVAALRLVRLANVRHGEYCVFQAEDRELLRTQALAMNAAETASAADAEVGWDEDAGGAAALDERRWALEQGAGGDYDAPYTSGVVGDEEMRARWLALRARHRYEAVGGDERRNARRCEPE